MSATQLPFLVEGILILTAMVLGGFLARKAKPYGKVKLSFHLFFFLWFSMGYYFIAQVLFTGRAWTGTGITVLFMGLALVVQIVTGVVMLVRKGAVGWLPWVHGVSAALLLVLDAAALFLSGTSS